MHLPFTFATGEAMLYQTGHPLRSFSEPAPGEAKGGRSEKGKESSSENLDPKSLLGALMSQDESVYVDEPAVSCCSSQQPTQSQWSGFLGHQRWGYDPLLATLDSLSLGGEDPCSNSELFDALESLGLNAEDLELLLLDERTIQVGLEPNHVPALSDLLTNGQVLSYTHHTLENSPERGEGEAGGCGVNAAPPVAPASPSIVQPSQQMQQHLRSGEQMRAHQPRTVAAPSQLNSELQHLLDSSLRWSPEQRPVHYVPHPPVSQDPPPLGFHSPTAVDAPYVPNGHAPLLPSAEPVWHCQNSQQQRSVAQSSALELEQLLGLSQSPPSLPAYHMFNTSTQGPAHGKVGPQEKMEQLMSQVHVLVLPTTAAHRPLAHI